MNKEFKIYIDRLRDGETEKISLSVDPSFMGVEERELSFGEPVMIEGETYLAENELVLNLSVKAVARLPCSICNQIVAYPIGVEKFYFTQPLAEIPAHIFDFSDLVREAVLLEVPFVVECNGGNCPSRKEIAKFLAPPHKSGDENSDGWQPFKDL